MSTTGQAMQGFVKDFGRTAALYIESCIHCGMCAEACHFHEATGDPKYTPIWKIEPFKQAYKRDYGPFAPFYRAFRLKKPMTDEQLREWQHLLYDSCNVCGRCSLMCPMGIDIAGLISKARLGMENAGLAPEEVKAPAAPVPDFRERIGRLARESNIEIPLDKPKAAVLCTTSRDELDRYPASIVATAKIMKHVGADWTLRTDAQDPLMAKEVIGAAIACGAQTLVLPECGRGYGALRWDGANVYGKPLPFRVLHMSEFLAENVRSGKLKVKADGKSATFHDPCQVSRRGGATDAPREVLAALGVELREMFPTKGTNWCCGGGGGVVNLRRADPLRHKVFHLKMEQIEKTGAELPVTSCTGCRRTFDDGQAHYQWNRTMQSLLELTAANLKD